MKISLRQTREEELSLLTKIETDAFNIQAKYFENGILPPFSKEEKEQNALTTLFKENDITMQSIYADDIIVGRAVVKSIDDTSKEVMLFFISPKYQGKGFGRIALQMVENAFADIKVWRLVTPTQVLRNAVFYVNKCGYKIVRIEEFDKRIEQGTFVFEKKKGAQ